MVGSQEGYLDGMTTADVSVNVPPEDGQCDITPRSGSVNTLVAVPAVRRLFMSTNIMHNRILSLICFTSHLLRAVLGWNT